MENKPLIVWDIWGPIYTYSPTQDMEETNQILEKALLTNIDALIKYVRDTRPDIQMPENPVTDVSFQAIAEEKLIVDGKLPIFPNISFVDTVRTARQYGLDTVLFTSGTLKSVRELTLPRVFEAYNRQYRTEFAPALIRDIISLNGTGMTKKNAETWNWFQNQMRLRGISTIIGYYFDDNPVHLSMGMKITGAEGYHCLPKGTPLVVYPQQRLYTGHINDLVETFISGLQKCIGTQNEHK